MSCLMKKSKSISELKLITAYLEKMPSLMMKLENSPKIQEYLNTISIILEPEIISENKIIFRYGIFFSNKGEKCENYYIVLKGEVSVIVVKETKMLLALEEYKDYLNNLSIFNEIEILNKCLLKNKSVYEVNESDLKVPSIIL